MYMACPVYAEEIEIVNIQHSPSSWDCPEDFDYDFSEVHPCQANWTREQQEKFDADVYNGYQESADGFEPDFDYHIDDDYPEFSSKDLEEKGE